MQDVAIQNTCPHRVECEEAYAEGQRHIRLQVSADRQKAVTVFRGGKDISKFAFFEEDTLLVMMFDDVTLGGPEALLAPGEQVLVSYYVSDTSQCPVCDGRGYMDDWMLGSNGDLFSVLNEDGLAQMLEKVLSTRLGSNKFHSWFGSELHLLFGEKVVDPAFTKSSIEGYIRDAIGRFTSAYASVWNSGTANPGDVLKSLDSVTVTQDELDPSVFYAVVVYTTGSGKQFSYEQSARLGYYKQAREAR